MRAASVGLVSRRRLRATGVREKKTVSHPEKKNESEKSARSAARERVSWSGGKAEGWFGVWRGKYYPRFHANVHRKEAGYSSSSTDTL